MVDSKLSAARVAALLAGFLIGAMPLSAAAHPDIAQSPDVLVLIDPLQQDAEDFQAMIGDAARYKLEKFGLATQVVSATSSDAAKPFPLARESGASVALVCRYQVEGQQMSVTLGWYDSKTGTPFATVQATGLVDLHLDRVILAALDEMIAKVQPEITSLSARREALAPAAQTVAAPLQPSSTLVVPPGSSSIAMPASAANQDRHHLLFSGGFAPFLPTGAAGYYFSMGYLPSIVASYFFDLAGGHVGLGIYSGVDYFNAVGVEDTSTNYLIPVGVDVRYELGSATLRPFFHVAGGPAFLVMVTGTQGIFVDILPFLKSGLGLEVELAPWMGINALVDYDMYFEMPYLLTGFTPSLNMVFRP